MKSCDKKFEQYQNDIYLLSYEKLKDKFKLKTLIN